MREEEWGRLIEDSDVVAPLDECPECDKPALNLMRDFVKYMYMMRLERHQYHCPLCAIS